MLTFYDLLDIGAHKRFWDGPQPLGSYNIAKELIQLPLNVD